jgi:hypothetical protein
MRRENYESIVISIIPGPACPTDRAAKLQSFKKDGLTSLNGEDFLNVFKEASSSESEPQLDRANQTHLGMCSHEHQPPWQAT